MPGPKDRDRDDWHDQYEEGRDFARSGEDDLDDIAGSAHEGDEYEYFAQEWADDE